MYKCYVTKHCVPRRTPAEKVVIEIRPVIYKVMWAGGDIEKMVTQTRGWEIIKEVLVSPKAVSQLPTIEQLIEKIRHQEPVIRTQYLKRRPRWGKRPQERRRGTMASKFPEHLRMAKK